MMADLKNSRTSKKRITPIVYVSLFFAVFFVCGIESTGFSIPDTVCLNECDDDLESRQRMCRTRYTDKMGVEICYDDANARYERCKKACE